MAVDTVLAMDRARALGELPETYAAALRLHEDGQPPEVISEHLEIDLTAVEPLLKVAHAKLRNLLTDSSPTRGTDTAPA